MAKQSVFLIGPLGAGKTSIGTTVANELHMKFYDSDQVIEDRAGVDVPWIFDVEGEEGFRDREAVVIEELTQMPNIVLATGGGAVLRPENRKFLAGRGMVVYLMVSIEQQLLRMERDTKRPLLRTEQKEEVLIELQEQREPLYQEISDYCFETDGRTVKAVANDIIKLLR